MFLVWVHLFSSECTNLSIRVFHIVHEHEKLLDSPKCLFLWSATMTCTLCIWNTIRCGLQYGMNFQHAMNIYGGTSLRQWRVLRTPGQHKIVGPIQLIHSNVRIHLPRTTALRWISALENSLYAPLLKVHSHSYIAVVVPREPSVPKS